MAFGIILEFDGVGQADYDAVNDKLGIELGTATNWPEGILSHAGGPTDRGWVVFEVWESAAHQRRFMEGRLGAALGAVGVPEPVHVTTSELHAYETPSS